MKKELCIVCDESMWAVNEWKSFDPEQIEGFLKCFRICEKHVDEIREIYFEKIT